MKEERIKILQMVEDGKISVEEAGKLLEAMGADCGCFGDCFDNGEFDDGLKSFCSGVEDFVKDASAAAVDFAKAVEPKVFGAAKVVVEKTVDVVQAASKSLINCIDEMISRLDEFEKGRTCDCCDDEDKSND